MESGFYGLNKREQMTQIEKYIERLKTLQNLYEEGQPQHNAFGIAIVEASEMLVKNCSIPDVSVAKHPLPRPLECWNKARKVGCGEYIEWHLEQERRGNAR